MQLGQPETQVEGRYGTGLPSSPEERPVIGPQRTPPDPLVFLGIRAELELR